VFIDDFVVSEPGTGAGGCGDGWRHHEVGSTQDDGGYRHEADSNSDDDRRRHGADDGRTDGWRHHEVGSTQDDGWYRHEADSNNDDDRRRHGAADGRTDGWRHHEVGSAHGDDQYHHGVDSNNDTDWHGGRYNASGGRWHGAAPPRHKPAEHDGGGAGGSTTTPKGRQQQHQQQTPAGGAVEGMVALLTSVRATVSAAKTRPTSGDAVACGWRYNTTDGTVAMPDDKRVRYTQLAAKLSIGAGTYSDLSTFVGCFDWYAGNMAVLSPFIAGLRAVLAEDGTDTYGRPRPTTWRPTADAITVLEFIGQAMSDNVPMQYGTDTGTPAMTWSDAHATASDDAEPHAGIGYIVRHGHAYTSREQHMHINEAELQAAVMAVEAAMTNTNGSDIVAFTDSMVVVHQAAAGHATSPTALFLLCVLSRLQMTTGRTVTVRHVPGAVNTTADLLSRDCCRQASMPHGLRRRLWQPQHGPRHWTSVMRSLRSSWTRSSQGHGQSAALLLSSTSSAISSKLRVGETSATPTTTRSFATCHGTSRSSSGTASTSRAPSPTNL
jgi:ribonuclease HI